MANPKLREYLDQGRFFYAPGVQDMIAAVLARDIGFDCVYATGYWLTASAYGLPDAGIASYTQMVDRVATLCRTLGPDVPVIADADTGYGGLLNVHHTVRGYEAAGVTGIQLEDQEFPKKCGHTPFKRVVPAETMVAKIKVARDATTDSNTLIIARTDALASEGFDSTLRRAEAYAEAGADVIFVEALTSKEEMIKANSLIGKPTMANMADGGKTPILTTAELEEIGYGCAIFPSMTSLAAARAMHTALTHLKATGDDNSPEAPLYDFGTFCSQIGFEDVWSFERKWGGLEA